MTMDSNNEEITVSIFDKVCRACLSSKSEETAVIFEVCYENVNLGDIFSNCVAVQIDRDDNLPRNICNTCIATLVQIYTFKQQCQQSDTLLRAALNHQQHSLIAVKDDLEILLEEATVEEKLKPVKKIISNTCKQVRYSEYRRSVHRKKYKFKVKVEDDNLESSQDVDSQSECAVSKRLKSKSYLCKYCNESFDSYSRLAIHRKQVSHPRPRNYACPECHKSFSYSHLQQHMRTHTKEKPFSCHICQMRFSLNCNLRRHIMTHTGERPHTCDICGKGFIQSTTLVDHKRTHTGETPFICSYCGMSFAQSSRHKAHLRKHFIENGETDRLNGSYECDICHRYFTTRGVLKTHRLTHGEKSFLCSQCGRGFVSNAGLLSHMKVHTGLRPYPCTVCNKAFSQIGSLKSHVLIHTGQKPFICKVCSKAFTQRNHLKYHTRTHSGERPYVCSYCDKSFALKGTLTVHVRTHTGETPYVCDICGKGFYDSSSMKKHRRGHGQLQEKVVLNQTNTVKQHTGPEK